MSEPYTIKVGDRRTALARKLMQGKKPVDLSGATVQFYMNDAAGDSVVAESSTGVTAHPTYSFTAVAASDRIVRNDHLVEKGDQVVFASTSALPAGLTAGTRYFVVNPTPNYFQIAEIPNGTAVNITDAGTGTHTYYVVGTVLKTFLAADVDTAGVYEARFTVTTDGVKDTFPPDTEGGIRVEIM